MNNAPIILTLNGTPLPKEAQTWEIRNNLVIDTDRLDAARLKEITDAMPDNSPGKYYSQAPAPVIATLNERIEGVPMLVVGNKVDNFLLLMELQIALYLGIHSTDPEKKPQKFIAADIVTKLIEPAYHAAQERGCYCEEDMRKIWDAGYEFGYAAHIMVQDQQSFNLKPSFEKTLASLNTGAIYVEVQETTGDAAVKEGVIGGRNFGKRTYSPIITPDGTITRAQQVNNFDLMKKNTQDPQQQYKSFLKRYDLQDQEVGKMFGYATRGSWQTSHRREKVIEGIIRIVNQVEGKVKDKLDLIDKLREME